MNLFYDNAWINDQKYLVAILTNTKSTVYDDKVYNDFMNQISFFNTTRFVSPQFSYKWDILTFGLHTSGRCHDRTKRSYSSDDPNKLDTWSAKTKIAIKTLRH